MKELWNIYNSRGEKLKNGLASDIGYFIFKEYYEKFYNRYLVFENGKPI